MSDKSNITPVDLKSFYRNSYNGSDLQKVNRNNPLPHKCTIKGQEFYYYNADLSGLMWLQGNDRRLMYNDFIDVYRKGFSDGLKHLQEQEGIKRRDYYKPKKKELIRQDLNYFLYEREFLPNHNGLQDLIKRTLLRWTEDNIYKQGYYNGLLHSIVTLDNDLNLKIGVSETSNDKTTTPPTLNDFFFNLKDKQCFLTELKETFTTEKGIDFSILLWLLKDAEILTIGEGKFASFHRLAKAFFTHDIGSKQSINDYYKHTESDIKNYKSNIGAISNKLNTLIDKHKS